MAKAALADDAAAGSNRFPYLGWVDIGHSHKEPKAGIGYLNPGQTHRVRVRAVNDNGASAWAVGSGAPLQAARTVSLSASPERVREGDPVTITATVKYEGRATPIQEGLMRLSGRGISPEARSLPVFPICRWDSYLAQSSQIGPVPPHAPEVANVHDVLIRIDYATPDSVGFIFALVRESEPKVVSDGEMVRLQKLEAVPASVPSARVPLHMSKLVSHVANHVHLTKVLTISEDVGQLG